MFAIVSVILSWFSRLKLWFCSFAWDYWRWIGPGSGFDWWVKSGFLCDQIGFLGLLSGGYKPVIGLVLHHILEIEVQVLLSISTSMWQSPFCYVSFCEFFSDFFLMLNIFRFFWSYFSAANWQEYAQTNENRTAIVQVGSLIRFGFELGFFWGYPPRTVWNSGLNARFLRTNLNSHHMDQSLLKCQAQ